MKEKKRPLGLYLHVPFCRSKCAYCDFYSLAGREDRMKAYTKALCAHLEETAPSAVHHQVDTIYFGGGTPSLLGHRHLLKILQTIQKKYDVAKDAEITLEANPESAQNWRELRKLRRGGFNRISLGVQSADDGILKDIGRIHTWAEVGTAVEAVRRAGIENLSLDLIYGLPGQTMENWQDTVEKALALRPEHLSCYGLKVEEGTPLWQRRDSVDLPDDDTQADMYLWTVEALRERGYYQYEISNFAKEGRASRHNLKYWTLGEYAGFGCGAHSDFGEVRYAYGRDLEGYIQGVLKGDLRVSESEYLPLRERDTEYIMLSLRTTAGMDKYVFEHTYRRWMAPLEGVFAKYEALGCAERTEKGWRLTPKGFLLSNTIIADLWEALGQEKVRREQARARGDFRIDVPERA